MARWKTWSLGATPFVPGGLHRAWRLCLVGGVLASLGSWGLAAPEVASPTPASVLAGQVKGTVQETWHSGVEWLAGGRSEPLVLQQGAASYLSNMLHGRKTASGERYDMNEFTAAHKTLPFGTRVIVRSLQTGREVAVRIVDRGPHLKSRIIDLSHAAAKALGLKSEGVAEVQLVTPGSGAKSPR